MKKTSKLFIILAIIMAFCVSSTGSVAGARKIDYVALGDSIAAGVRATYGQLPGWELESDFGYTDQLAANLADEGVLGKFDETYSVSGMTAANLAQITSTAKGQGLARLKTAEIVTLRVGADDLLGLLYDYFDYCVANELTPTQEGAMAALEQILMDFDTTSVLLYNNLVTILQNVMAANDQVQVYVMGYYNPLPFITIEYGGMTITLDIAAQAINDIIFGAIMAVDPMGTNISYVDTLTAINDGYWQYAYVNGYLLADTGSGFPDIHPTETGYQVIATNFWDEIDQDFDF